MSQVKCTSNKSYEASLKVNKFYQIINDPKAARQNMIRVIDETNSDYLYPSFMFAGLTETDFLMQGNNGARLLNAINDIQHGRNLKERSLMT